MLSRTVLVPGIYIFGGGWICWGIIFHSLDSGRRNNVIFHVILLYDEVFSYSGSSTYLCFWTTSTRTLEIHGSMNILVATFSVATTDDLPRHYCELVMNIPTKIREPTSQSSCNITAVDC